MHRRCWKAAIWAATMALTTPSSPASADEALALRRVMLSSGGVGYLEYEATVHGNAEIPLDVRLDQVDDVLKSIVVVDDKGGLGRVTFPGREGFSEVLHDLPFDAAALRSEPALLEALRGADVVVTTGRGSVEGRVLSITEEPTHLPGGSTVTRHRLALAANGTVTSLLLEDAEHFSFADSALQHALDRALTALVGDKTGGRRTLVIHATGSSERVVHVGYVVAVPLWKSTYRLTLPFEPQPSTGMLQGLAVVENQSGVGWKDVELTLVAGNPVTFHQVLYQTYYVTRPEVPVEVVGRVLPRLDTGATSVGEKRDYHGFAGPGAGAPRAVPAPDFAGESAAESSEVATQVVFRIPSPVTLEEGEDALIPIVEQAIPVARISLYQPDIQAVHPLTAVELTNGMDTGLPPGVLTTYARSSTGAVTYLGDARLATLPAGERRLVSFGVDQAVRIDRRVQTSEGIAMATLAGGMLHLTRMERRSTFYTIQGAAREARTVIVEHPRLEGFRLAQPPGPVDTTEAFYRIRIDVPKGETKTLEVTLEKPLEETIALMDLASKVLAEYTSTFELSPEVREALGQVATLRVAVEEKAAAVSAIESELSRIIAQQVRIRDNLKVVPAGSALAQRYVTLLAEQEDQIEALQATLQKADEALVEAKRALSDTLQTLRIGGR